MGLPLRCARCLWLDVDKARRSLSPALRAARAVAAAAAAAAGASGHCDPASRRGVVKCRSQDADAAGNHVADALFVRAERVLFAVLGAFGDGAGLGTWPAIRRSAPQGISLQGARDEEGRRYWGVSVVWKGQTGHRHFARGYCFARREITRASGLRH